MMARETGTIEEPAPGQTTAAEWYLPESQRAFQAQRSTLDTLLVTKLTQHLRLSGILTEIEFARLSSTAFIHIMRTMEDTRADFRTRPTRAGPRGSFGTLLDPD